MSNPRPSTDEETAPLLDQERSHDSFLPALFHPSRPLTNLEKLFTAAGIALLLLTSTFIGLFAGAENALKKEKGKSGGGGGWSTTTVVTTATKTSGATTTISAVPTGKPSANVCFTKDCVMLSANILQYLNASMDPCDDFSQFATGGWDASHQIPADRGRFGSFDQVADENTKIVARVLEAIPSKLSHDPTTDELNLHKLKSFYDSCMDLDKLNEVGLGPLSSMIDELVEMFGEFDIVPAPEADFVEVADWASTWDESYTLPPHLVDAARKVESLHLAKTFGGVTMDRSAVAPALNDEQDLEDFKFDEERKQRLTKALAFVHSRNAEALVNFDIEGDVGGEDSQLQGLQLYQTFGGLPSKEYYEEKPILDLYTSVVKGVLIDVVSHGESLQSKRDLVGDIAGLVAETELKGWPFPWPGDDDKGGKNHPGDGHEGGRDEPLEDRMERLATKIVAFERELVRAGASAEQLGNARYTYNPYSTSAVVEALPFFDFSVYLSAFNPRVYPQNITVTHPPYLKAVRHLVQSTPDYVLSGYFSVRLALSWATALGPKTGVRAETRRLEEVLKGLEKGTEENRQDVCFKFTDNVLGFIEGREFVREAFSPEAKEDGENIIRSIVKAFYNKLPHIAWMDEESSKAAQKKAQAIIPKIGYPLSPDTTDPDSLANWYQDVKIVTDDFFGSILSSSLAEGVRQWRKLGRIRDRREFEMTPQTVNAYYSPADGEIVFAAGILQPPFYSQSWPSYLKYGAFGAVASHELTHAFDNNGALFDDKGRISDWWTNATVKAFEERSECIANQYSKYYVYDEQGNKVYLNGNLTNGENIGDSGLAQAFTAWKDSMKSSSADDNVPLRLPGLEFTEEQLFFISFGRIWAQMIRPATAVSKLRSDPHSPPYWRITGTLRNMPAFHEAFGCKPGSNMNPPKSEQCELW